MLKEKHAEYKNYHSWHDPLWIVTRLLLALMEHRGRHCFCLGCDWRCIFCIFSLRGVAVTCLHLIRASKFSKNSVVSLLLIVKTVFLRDLYRLYFAVFRTSHSGVNSKRSIQKFIPTPPYIRHILWRFTRLLGFFFFYSTWLIYLWKTLQSFM